MSCEVAVVVDEVLPLQLVLVVGRVLRREIEADEVRPPDVDELVGPAVDAVGIRRRERARFTRALVVQVGAAAVERRAVGVHDAVALRRAATRRSAARRCSRRSYRYRRPRSRCVVGEPVVVIAVVLGPSPAVVSEAEPLSPTVVDALPVASPLLPDSSLAPDCPQPAAIAHATMLTRPGVRMSRAYRVACGGDREEQHRRPDAPEPAQVHRRERLAEDHHRQHEVAARREVLHEAEGAQR